MRENVGGAAKEICLAGLCPAPAVANALCPGLWWELQLLYCSNQ